jgi:hypothetical protein
LIVIAGLFDARIYKKCYRAKKIHVQPGLTYQYELRTIQPQNAWHIIYKE